MRLALRGRQGRWGRATLALGLLGSAAVGVGYPLWWDHRSSAAGQVLLQRGLDLPQVSTERASGSAACSIDPSSSAATSSRPGVLDIPSIGLQAPVLSGLGTAVLDVAVGHDSATVWPGKPGESLLLAHDVSYFSGLGRVRIGDTVVWRLGCQEATFRVFATSVVKPGVALPVPPSGSGLALVTCWPTDALFWTSKRYVVETTLLSKRTLANPATHHAGPAEVLVVPAPAALRAGGLTLQQSGMVEGTLSISGTPLPSFSESPVPLADAHAALEDDAAAAKTAATSDQAWWASLAQSGVALPMPWTVHSAVDVTIAARGSTVTAVVLSSATATVHLVVVGHDLVVSSVVEPGVPVHS